MHIKLTHPIDKKIAAAAIKSMRVVVDTREQENSHIIEYFNQKKIPFVKRKLDFADYSCEINSNLLGLQVEAEWLSFENKVVVERKNSIDEIANCVGSDRDRFEAEFKRVKAAGAKCVLLLEKFSFDHLFGDGKIFQNSYTKMTSEQIAISVNSFVARYDLHLQTLVDNKHSGRLINNLLSRYAYESLIE
jgi:ERCC4-type nuclease